MKRLGIGALVTLLAASFGLAAAAAPSSAAQRNIGRAVVAQDQAAPAPDFGSPPSGAIPILYNDHHVYAKPDTLRQDRVLAALVRNGTVLIPLRSMFEQMGASVAYDPSSQTVTVSKAGASVQVTVGKPEVVINGETRPLDVPPIMYHGTVLVPVRVISEGMGAYVQWVPDRHIVVVRYVPPTPPPTPAPPPPPTAAPPPPTPAPPPPSRAYNDLYVAGDYLISPKVYNEFSPGNTGKSSYAVRGGFEFNAFNLPWMLEGTYTQFGYPHNQGVATPAGYAPSVNDQCTALGVPAGDPGCVTNIGGVGQTFVPAFTARDQDFDGRFGLKVANPRIYIGVGYLWRTNNYGYPRENGFGFGIEKLPDLNQALSFYGSAWYYPNLKGNYTAPNGSQYSLAYRLLKYQVGAAYVLGNSPVFLDLGWIGENGMNKQNAPSGFTANGPYLGLGIKF